MTANEEGDSGDHGEGETRKRRPTVRVMPAPGETIALVRSALERGELLTLFGRCTVDYDGRASSKLGPGDRHVMCKPDGAVLVHTENGQQPVNWQPPGSTHEAILSDGSVRLLSHRTTPPERLVVTFETVAHVAAFAVRDPGVLDLVGTEADLRRRILDDPALVETGFRALATERETAAGAVDIYGEDVDGRAVVVELKRRRAGPDAVGQLDRYVTALRRDIHTDADVRGVLVAPSITDRARRLLAANGLEFVSLAPRPTDDSNGHASPADDESSAPDSGR